MTATNLSSASARSLWRLRSARMSASFCFSTAGLSWRALGAMARWRDEANRLDETACDGAMHC
eukprot:6623632-Pyramimonas_sp.AAC.1